MVGRKPGPEFKGTGFWASLGALRHLAKEGRCSARLDTDDFRLPAIVIYLRLGFRPLLVHPNQRERWRRVLARLGMANPVPESLEELLDGPVLADPA